MKTPTILIVDDEEKNVKLLKAMLMRQNYNLLGAHSGEEALRLVLDTSPDLFLLDVMMPGMDGFEVCQRLKQDEKTKMAPILMITALTEKENRVKAMEAGADDFLNKPVDQTELVVRVKSLLRIKSYHDELFKSYREIAEKNEKLRELEKAKDGLTHMIIHDLRNPLTAISAYLQLILMDKDNLSDGQREKMEKCLKFCRDLSHQIQSLLDINKMEEGKLVPQREVTNLPELIDGILEQFNPVAEERKISLSFSRQEEIPPIPIDRSLIKRVIANLLNNAIRHTPQGGTIQIAVNLVPEKGRLCLSVKDDGDGLAREYHQKIFDKFEQVKLKSEEGRVGSSGLGLTFCKMAVEAHGGKIWVESEGEGHGCTFRSLLPVCP